MKTTDYLIIACLVGFGALYHFYPPSRPIQMVQLIAGITGTLLGFVFAGLTIFVALSDHELITNMKKHGHYKTMLNNFFKTSALLFIAMAFSIAAVWSANTWIYLAAVAFFGGSLCQVLALGHQFYIVLDIITDP